MLELDFIFQSVFCLMKMFNVVVHYLTFT